MKTPQYRKGILLAQLILGSWMVSQSVISAQEARPPRPPHGERAQGADNAGPNMERERRQLWELRLMGHEDEANRLEMRMRGRHMDEAKPQSTPQGDANQPRQKMMHLKQAVEHLTAAGYEKQANMAREEIARIENEVRGEMEKKAKQEMEAREAKKEHTERPEASDEMRDQVNKMRRQMEEMNRQISRLKEELKKAERPAPKE